MHVCFPLPDRLDGSGATENVEIVHEARLCSAQTGLAVMEINPLPG